MIYLNGFTVHSDVVDFHVELRHGSSLYFNRQSLHTVHTTLCLPYKQESRIFLLQQMEKKIQVILIESVSVDE